MPGSRSSNSLLDDIRQFQRNVDQRANRDRGRQISPADANALVRSLYGAPSNALTTPIPELRGTMRLDPAPLPPVWPAPPSGELGGQGTAVVPDARLQALDTVLRAVNPIYGAVTHDYAGDVDEERPQGTLTRLAANALFDDPENARYFEGLNNAVNPLSWGDMVGTSIGRYGRGDADLMDTINLGTLGHGSMALPVVAPARRLLGQGARELEQQVARSMEAAPGIRAYHGSPHDFDRFELSPRTIGTGEGAQAYGHGLYFAENPDTARSYRDSLVGRGGDGWDMRIRGTPVEEVYRRIDENAARLPVQEAQVEYDKLAAIESLMQHGDPDGVRNSGQLGPEALRWFDENIAPNFTRSGHMYEVNINADPNSLLDWDRPLSEQGRTVQEGLGILDADMWHPSGNDYDPNELGQSVYQRLFNQKRDYGIDSGRVDLTTMGGAQMGAANDLRQAGIPGIRFLDQGSRTAGEGTSNYVIFDDRLIDILRKYGLAAPVVGTGALMGFGAGHDQPEAY